MKSSKTRYLMIPAAVIGLSALFFSGCNSAGLFGGTQANAPTEAPVAPAPVVIDGTRASYADIVQKTAPAVVKVSSERKNKRQEIQGGEGSPMLPFGIPQQPQQQQPRGPSIQRGLGSGVLVSADGTILTNNHVIDGADKVQVEMTDKRSFEAKVIGTDALSDLAVLKIEGADLPYVQLGDSDRVRVGDIVLAIGNPLGIGQTVTAGIISAKGRRTGLSDGSFEDFLQTDAPINQGNSGGPLISVTGELIGINSQILSPGGGNIGIGFSIPSNMAKSVMEQLIKDGKVHRGQLGVNIQNITADLVDQFKLKSIDGAVVSNVLAGSPADKAGVKRGDVIVGLNGEKVEDSNTLRNKVAATAPGTEVTLKINRDGGETELKVTLGEATPEKAAGEDKAPSDKDGEPSETGKLGITVVPVTPEIAKRLQLPPDSKGLAVTEMDASGPAAEAGIREGDVILEANRQEVNSAQDMQAALAKSGNKALLLVSRKGQMVYLTVTLQ